MPITLTPLKTRLSEIAARTEDAPQDGLRRWTADEYQEIETLNLFGDQPMELRHGLVWNAQGQQPHLWTREQYHCLADVGLFDDERVELLEGEIWKMAPQTRPHFRTIRAVTEALEEVFGPNCDVQQQAPVAFSGTKEPEPDVAVVTGSWADYEDHPMADDILLLVEVSASSLGKDRGSKRAAYARAGIQDYWIVNLVDRQIEVYRRPSSEGTYADSKIYLPGEGVAPLHTPDRPIAVADLLPPLKQS